MNAQKAPLVVVMGVSGCGKSTLGALLAHALHADFLEGDKLHPPRNVELMAAGVALTDADRRDWLMALAAQLKAAADANRALVVSCSALKRSYRDVLRGTSNESGDSSDLTGSSELAFVHLHGDAALLDARMNARVGHYMPASLLASQLATLEAPGADERAVTLDAALPTAQAVAQALAWLAAMPASMSKSASTSASTLTSTSTSTSNSTARPAP